jgi:hypothetical protein
VDLKLDNFGDLDLTSGGLELVEGTDAITQHIKIRLRFVLGEWFLDTRIGLPYYQTILVKNPRLVIVQALFARTIRETPGVESLERIRLAIDGATRILTVTFTAILQTSDVPIDLTMEFIL